MRRLLIPLSVAALLACPAGASAAKKPVKLNIKVEGTQTTDWKYTKKQNPSCDWPEHGQGKQVIEFESVKKGVTMEATQKGDRVAFDEKGFLVSASAKLNASRDRLISQISPCPDGGGPFGGGDGPNQDVHTEGKCSILGSIEFRLGTARDAIWEVGDPARPAKEIKKDRLLFRGVPSWQGEGDSPTNLPAACDASGQPNADIGLQYGPVEWGGGLVETADKITTKDLLTKKKIKINGQATIKYPNKTFREPGPADTTGSTNIVLKVTITRAR